MNFSEHFKQISTLINDVIEAPDKIKNLQTDLLKLIHRTKNISLEFSDDMEEDFKEIEQFQVE